MTSNPLLPRVSDMKRHKPQCTVIVAPPVAKREVKWHPFQVVPRAEVASSSESVRIPCAGLANIGNTCFLNSTLQCLLHVPLVWSYLRLIEHRSECTAEGCVLCELCGLATDYAQSNGRTLTPRALVRRASAGGMQLGEMHDSHEFLECVLLQGLLNANLRGAPKATGAALDELERQTLEHHLFGGTLRSVNSCSGCGCVSWGSVPKSDDLRIPARPPHPSPPPPGGRGASLTPHGLVRQAHNHAQ